MPGTKIQTKLCLHCANSIGADALSCPYCKADLSLSIEPEWPPHVEEMERSRAKAEREKLPVRSKVILVLGLLVFALGIYLVGGNVERHDMGPQLAAQEWAIKERDEKITKLETQLAELRRGNQGTGQQIDKLKAKLEEAEKDLAAAQKRLATANNEIARLSTSQAAPAPQRTVRAVNPSPIPTAAARAQRTAEPRLYETLRSSPVYEQPNFSSRVVAQIGGGTQITVVGSGGGWLEVRSNHGKPPGYIRADDAMFLSRAN